jgi:hypothetical protein
MLENGSRLNPAGVRDWNPANLYAALPAGPSRILCGQSDV